MNTQSVILGAILTTTIATVIVLLEGPRYTFALAAVGPMVAGASSGSSKYDGAVEGAASAGTAVPVVVFVVAAFRLFVFRGNSNSPFELLWYSTGPQAIGAMFVVFPLALAIGAAVGWLGLLIYDVARKGVATK